MSLLYDIIWSAGTSRSQPITERRTVSHRHGHRPILSIQFFKWDALFQADFGCILFTVNTKGDVSIYDPKRLYIYVYMCVHVHRYMCVVAGVFICDVSVHMCAHLCRHKRSTWVSFLRRATTLVLRYHLSLI